MNLVRGRYVEAPERWDRIGRAVFLAGGIMDCEDWQQAAASWFRTESVVVLNPRQTNFPMHYPSVASAQIRWEFEHLHAADVVLFWFTGGRSPQPIALYELGRYAALQKPIAVGCDPAYLRRSDVFIQLALARPEIEVAETLAATCARALKLVGSSGSGTA